jgi:hypothetical protein
MNDKVIKAQSEAAYKQWAEQWRDHCIQNKKFEKKSWNVFENSGIGKAILCVGNGYSLEENIEIIKKYKDNVDIICCDKTLGHLINNGIYPTFCVVCDANVDYDKYLKPYEDKLKNTILFINACANPKWSHNGNWKNKYFFVNKDILKSEKEFMELSGTVNVMPAGTNVSNAMLILITQSDNEGRRNFFGYDKIILIGYDYSWKAEGGYYAFDHDGSGKRNYMTHTYAVSPAGNFIYTSGNLNFSCDWLSTYVSTYALPVVQCAKDSIFQIGKCQDLETQMQYRFKIEDKDFIQCAFNEIRLLELKLNELKQKISKIGREHWLSNVSTTN